jgi:hypothetical protein
MTTITDANLQDVKGDSLLPHIPNPLAQDTKNFLVEYGVRLDDQAMVFHFFSPKDAVTWDPTYRMDARLKRAIDGSFDVSRVTAGFAPDVDSFYVIVGGLGASPDPWTLAERFLASIDAPLEAAS